MREVAWDCEADNLLDKVTKIHCLSYRYVDKYEEVFTLTTTKEIEDFFSTAKEEDYILIGHNIICYDFPALKKVLGIEWKGKKIDTLPLSWYLNHSRTKHGLGDYGEEFGVKKPVVEDWSEQPIETYTHRCQEDTLIQVKTWLQLKKKLQGLYGASDES